MLDQLYPTSALVPDFVGPPTREETEFLSWLFNG
jgi:hypothetical protein